MIVLCTICSDIINQSENIHVTKCGHIFHYDCLNKWIVRSQSCPQCRNKVTEASTFRVFPNTADSIPSADEEAANLQIKLDHAMFNLKQQTQELNACYEKIESSTNTLQALRAEIRDLEKKVLMKDCALTAHKEQLLYYKEEYRQMKKVQEDIESQKKNLEIMQGLQTVFNSTVEEVEHMLQGNVDVRAVATFATALKKALDISEKKHTKLRNSVQSLKQEMAMSNKKFDDSQIKYQQLEEKYKELKKDYESLKKDLESSTEAKDSYDEYFWTPPPKLTKCKQKPTATSTNGNNTSVNTLVNKIETAESPYLNLKQSSVAWAALQKPSTSRTKKKVSPLGGPSNSIADYSIFDSDDGETKDRQSRKSSFFNISSDGIGEQSSPEYIPSFTRTKNPIFNIPKLTAKHKLKRPNSEGVQNIAQKLKKNKHNE